MATNTAERAAGEILDRLARLHPRLIDLSLERMERLVARLGRPDLALPPVVHVAGTNGKGSLIAYLRAGLEAAGRRVHVYTSPHLVRFNERIRLAGRLISDEALVALLEEVERVNAGEPITQFEITTAAALLAFAREPADMLLLETGLGGEFDATNLVARPALAAITPIDYDHMEFLGPTLSDIARAKAGILKPGVAAVIGPQHAEAEAVIEARAARLGAPLLRHGREWRIEPVADGFLWCDAERSLAMPRPALAGPHQLYNAGTAVAALLSLETRGLPLEAIRIGLVSADWPARMQRLRRGPLLEAAGPEAELWLDGGHNPHCAQAIRGWASGIEPGPTIDVVLGMKSNKDLRAFIAELAPVTRQVIGIAIPGDPACHQPGEIVAVAQGLGLMARPADGPAEAVALAGRDHARRILIAGSLYLAGAILARNG
ncbi:MAG: bifunctional folylpolyglutamate synthase/dihydrofolate synthase [Alphaproteobacteria bacterium]|nr:bifunctional folylpolyglutamate synthase/dihydrofolate synthase [Alphaproteobacteria bacterium]